MDQLTNLCSIINPLPPQSSSQASFSHAAESAQAAASSIASHKDAPGRHLAPLQASSASRIAVASKLNTPFQAPASSTSSIKFYREEQMIRSEELCRGSKLIAELKEITDLQQAPTLTDITVAQFIA